MLSFQTEDHLSSTSTDLALERARCDELTLSLQESEGLLSQASRWFWVSPDKCRISLIKVIFHEGIFSSKNFISNTHIQVIFFIFSIHFFIQPCHLGESRKSGDFSFEANLSLYEWTMTLFDLVHLHNTFEWALVLESELQTRADCLSYALENQRLFEEAREANQQIVSYRAKL